MFSKMGQPSLMSPHQGSNQRAAWDQVRKSEPIKPNMHVYN